MRVYTTSCFEFDDNETNKELNVPPKKSGDGSILPQQRKEKNDRTILISSVKQANVAANPAAPVFMCIPKSHHKDKELPFCKCTNPKSATKVERKFNKASKLKRVTQANGPRLLFLILLSLLKARSKKKVSCQRCASAMGLIVMRTS